MKPILFNTEMVRAILDNRKTVTRQVIKPQEKILDNPVFGFTLFTPDGHISVRGEWIDEEGNKRYGENFIKMRYQPGDILYVRETWQHGFGGTYLYKASAGYDLFMTADGELVSDIPWRPSINMPREAARIFLRVTNVRVERLQDITAEQCVSEGLGREPLDEVGADFMCGMYHDLWDSTIKPKDLAIYGWDANPWVEVIEFERINKEE